MMGHLGRYEIICELGQGAMGFVYKARDPLIDRTVAIKTINLSLALDYKEEYEGRFYQEAKAAGRLSHPNIVTVYDVGKSADVAYIAMEFLQGRELRNLMDEKTYLPINQILDIVVQVAQGLAYAHENGIVHRDIKPSNIMVIRDGQVKITDFGIARMESSSLRTQTGMVLGSPKYMSPEQVLGKTIDQRTDIFSLGVMLYEMLAGRPPFTGDTINAVMHQTINIDPPPPSTLNPEVPVMLNFIVGKALAKELNYRYQNAKELADDLRVCRDSLPRYNAQEAPPKPVTNPRPGNSDSFEATLRVDSMTVQGDAGESEKTLVITRPNLQALRQDTPLIVQPEMAVAAKPKVTPTHITRTIPLEANPDKDVPAPRLAHKTKLILLMLLLLVLLGLVYIH